MISSITKSVSSTSTCNTGLLRSYRNDLLDRSAQLEPCNLMPFANALSCRDEVRRITVPLTVCAAVKT
jgi:hypothetical protein